MTRRLRWTALFYLLIAVGVQHLGASADGSQEKKEREEREKTALALIDQIRTDAQTLKLPDNRSRISLKLAQLIWSRDEKRARSLLNDAVAALMEFTEQTDREREIAYSPQMPPQLRQEILQFVAARDARLAIDILRRTRPSSYRWQPNFEAQLEMRLAVQVAQKDPPQALAAGQDSLNSAVDYESLNLLYALQSKDKGAAEIFFQSLMGRLRADRFSKGTSASSVALTLLRAWADNNRSASEQPAQRTTTEISLPGLNEQSARELSSLILTEVLGDSAGVYPGQRYAILQQLKSLIPDIERLSPNQMASLRERIDENDKFNAAQRGVFSKYDALFQNATIEMLAESAATAPVEIADGLMQRAATKAINEADPAVARQIIEKIGDPRQRLELTSSLDRQLFYRAREQKNLSEAREIIARLPSTDEQANFLAQLASDPAVEGDNAQALQLLSEAEALAGGRASNYAQLGAQLQIAQSYERLDVGKCTAMIERVIDRVDELSSAALALSGFDLQGQYFRQGEFVTSVSTPLGNLLQGSARLLGLVSRKNFESSKLVAERFARPEMRITALLAIAEAALGESAQ